MKKLNWSKINATSRKQSAQAAQDAEDAYIPPPDEPDKFYDVLNFYLTKKTVYFIPINAPHANGGNLRKVTHFALLRMSGDKLTCTRHEFTFWEVQGNPKQVQEIIDSTPTFTQLTKPFVFHMIDEAKAEVARILAIHGKA